MPSHARSPQTLATGLVVRPAGEADAELIASLGARLFAQAYGPTHPEPELGAYLATAFRPADLADRIRLGIVAVLLVEADGAGPIGYAQLRPDAPLDIPEWRGRPAIEIQRFYLDRAWHGRGIADALMASCVALAGRAGAALAWLQVWQEAHWAIRFYERAGFVIVGSTPFTWGSRVETDWLMARTLSPERPT